MPVLPPDCAASAVQSPATTTTVNNHVDLDIGPPHIRES
jgi:hypothetical protein